MKCPGGLILTLIGIYHGYDAEDIEYRPEINWIRCLRATLESGLIYTKRFRETSVYIYTFLHDERSRVLRGLLRLLRMFLLNLFPYHCLCYASLPFKILSTALKYPHTCILSKAVLGIDLVNRLLWTGSKI